MKEKKKIILGAIGVFILGVFWGFLLGNSKISNLQGYLFKMVDDIRGYNATSSNVRCVTCSNATSSNVRCVTCSNATSSNATSSNVAKVLYLNRFGLRRTTVNVGEYVPLDLSIIGNYKSGGSVLFKNVNTNMVLSVPIIYMDYEPTIQIPFTAVAGTYEVTDVLLLGVAGNTTFTRQYSKRGIEGTIWYNFNSLLIVKNPLVSDVPAVNNIKFNNSAVKQGSKVGIYYTSTGDFYSLYLMFEGLGNSNNKFNAYVKSLNSNPYFDVPTNVPEDLYRLGSIVVISKEGTRRYVQGPDYTVDSSLSVQLSNNLETYLYNNEDISGTIIQNIYNVNGNANIVVNADAMTVVNSELFNAIKGQNKKLTINYGDNQIVFNGKDIVDSKAVDAEMRVAYDNENIQSLVNDGVVVHFADNGNLPGKALVRIQSTPEVDQVLGNSKVYVYYYNEGDNNFSLVANSLSKTKDGYYEFVITHNSDYVLVGHKLDKSLVVANADVVSFEKPASIYLVLIVVAVIVIVGLVVVILVQNANKKKTSYEKRKSETSNDGEWKE